MLTKWKKCELSKRNNELAEDLESQVGRFGLGMKSNRVELHASPAAEREMTKPAGRLGLTGDTGRSIRPAGRGGRMWCRCRMKPPAFNPGPRAVPHCFQLLAAVGKLGAEVVWGKHESNPL